MLRDMNQFKKNRRNQIKMFVHLIAGRSQKFVLHDSCIYNVANVLCGFGCPLNKKDLIS